MSECCDMNDLCMCCERVIPPAVACYQDEDGNVFCDVRCYSEWMQRGDDAARERALDSRMELQERS